MPLLPASLVICTRGRPGLLEGTVASILAGDALPRELVVVDQSPAPAGAVAALGARDGCALRYLHTPHEVGLSRARRRALAAVRERTVVITDDDVTVEPDWLRTLLAALDASPPRTVVTGRVLPGPTDAADGIVPTMNPATEPVTYRGRVAQDVLFTMNVALRLDALDEVGGFDERLGPGTWYPGGEDNDLGYRLLEAGYAIRFVPRAVVHHLAWRTADDLVAVKWAYARGSGAFLAKHLSLRDGHAARRLGHDLRRHLVRAVRLAPVRARRQTLADVVYCAGLLAGAGRFLLVDARRPPVPEARP